MADARPPHSPLSAADIKAALSAPAPEPGAALPAPRRPEARPASSASSASDEGGAKETVESILVAFVLAFIFRAFIVEAFVIPTGSMAPTLMGAHTRYRCEDCGYPFDVNFTGRSTGDDVDIPSVARGRVYSVYCANCGLKVARENANDPDNDATAPSVHYGDRILVLKYAYLLGGPGRWDVVVFKSPDPQQGVPLYTTNYIKRLVGRPNESVFILDGDVYAGPNGARLEEHVVQTKPRVAQERLWRIVYDNDYLPARHDWRQPWTPVDGAPGWDLAGGGKAGRVFRFDAAGGGGAAGGASWIRFDPGASPDTEPLTDWLAYAATKYQGNEPGDYFNTRGIEGRNNVGDVKLSLFYERKAGDGPLRLQLTKLDDAFVAEITPGKVRLLRRNVREPDGAETEVMPPAALDLPATAPMHVELTNVDYQVTVRINGRNYLRTTPEQYRPDMARLLAAYRDEETLPKPEVRVGADAQQCALSHVTLWRDVYYTNRDYDTNRIRWATPDEPVQLGPDQFFVLGDNSLMSGDGRYWNTPVDLPAEGLAAQPGVVPGRFMLGKAFFVYWPAGYRPYPGLPGLVPNFGDMRFIH